MKDDGGSAFPQIGTGYDQDAHEYNGNVHSEGGMSLRDYFAASALMGVVANAFQNAGPERYELRADFVASEAYQYADAMLKERAK